MGIYILIIRHIFENWITGPAKKSKYTARYWYGFEDENAIAFASISFNNSLEWVYNIYIYWLSGTCLKSALLFQKKVKIYS